MRIEDKIAIVSIVLRVDSARDEICKISDHIRESAKMINADVEREKKELEALRKAHDLLDEASNILSERWEDL